MFLYPSDCVTGSRQQVRKGLKRRREVFPLWLRGLWKALHHCPPSQGRWWCCFFVIMCVHKNVFMKNKVLLVPTQVWDCLKTIFPSQRLPMMLLVCFFSLSTTHAFVCMSCRYTSAPTLETNPTSVTILAVGRSLQQVAVESSSFLTGLSQKKYIYYLHVGTFYIYLSF